MSENTKSIVIRKISEENYIKAVQLKVKLHCNNWREFLEKVMYIAGAE